MPNGPLKFLNLKYEVLQLDISNFKSTSRLMLKKKIKHAKPGNAMLNTQPLNGPLNYKMNSHNKLVSQKSRRVNQTYGITQTFKTLKYLNLKALLDLSSMAKFFY